MASTGGVPAKNKNPAPIQVSAEQLIADAASRDGTRGNTIGGPGDASTNTTGTASPPSAAIASSVSGAVDNSEDPAPKRQRTSEHGTSDTNRKHDTTTTTTTTSSSESEKIASKCRTATLFVGNLHPRVGDAHLLKLFSPYGNVQRATIVTHNAGPHTGQPKGYAFVEFDRVESARAAIVRVHGRMLLNKSLVVRPAHEKTSTTDDSREGPATSSSAAISDPRQARKAKSEVESKIEAVKRAIEEKRARAAAGRSFDRDR